MGYYACETTVFLNGKYSNTTYISKFDQSKKLPEPEIKQKNPNLVKKTAVATLSLTGRQR